MSFELPEEQMDRFDQILLSKMQPGKRYLEHELEPFFIEAYKEVKIEMLEDMLEELAEEGVIGRRVDENGEALYFCL